MRARRWRLLRGPFRFHDVFLPIMTIDLNVWLWSIQTDPQNRQALISNQSNGKHGNTTKQVNDLRAPKGDASVKP